MLPRCQVAPRQREDAWSGSDECTGPAGGMRRVLARFEPPARSAYREPRGHRVDAGGGHAAGRKVHPRGLHLELPGRRAAIGLAQERHLQPVEPAGQAERLHRERAWRERAVHRRGGLRRRLREAGPRPDAPGDPPPARQGVERRERARFEGVREQGAVRRRHRPRLRHRQDVRHQPATLRPHHHPGRRRLRRQSHRDAAAHLFLPLPPQADCARQDLPRPAAALPRRHRQADATGRSTTPTATPSSTPTPTAGATPRSPVSRDSAK